MSQITIIGGGLAGLTAAVACAEAGAEVVVHEAHATLGGRARTSEPPWLAHEGPHAFYADGPHWHWLVERDLVGAARTLPLREVRGHLVPPRRAPAPDAAGEPAAAARPPAPPRAGGRRLPHVGRRAARRGGGAGGGAPAGGRHLRRRSGTAVGRLRLGPAAPRHRGPRAGGAVARRGLAVRGRPAGGACPGAGRPDRDVVARRRPARAAGDRRDAARVRPGPARDDTLAWESGRCVLLDVGLVATRRDAFLVVDLDDAGFVERVTGVDATLAPAGHALVQADMPLKPGEPRTSRSPASSTCSTSGFPRWRERVVWRRDRVRGGPVRRPGPARIHLARPAGGRPRRRGLPRR